MIKHRVRPPCARTTLRTAMHGVTSLMPTPDPERTDGAKMESLESPTIINASVSDYRSGMARILSLRNVSLGSLDIRETMEKIAKSSTTTWIQHQLTLT